MIARGVEVQTNRRIQESSNQWKISQIPGHSPRQIRRHTGWHLWFGGIPDEGKGSPNGEEQL
jgi:hypothetical protein